MKEAEATTKVCPFTLMTVTRGKPAEGAKCIASGCMAWINKDKLGEVSHTHGYCARIGK